MTASPLEASSRSTGAAQSPASNTVSRAGRNLSRTCRLATSFNSVTSRSRWFLLSPGAAGSRSSENPKSWRWKARSMSSENRRIRPKAAVHPRLTFECHDVLERPTSPEVLLHDQCVAEAQAGGCFGEQVASFGGTPSGHLLHVASYGFPDNSARTGRIQSGAASACRPKARR